jgi:UDPglucose 6-dehydrogenase
MKIAVVGTGYVGLVSGTCFAELGLHVTCVDKDAGKIEALLRGEIPIYEPGLHDMVKKNVKAGRLSFTTELSEATKGAKAAFIAVGTPPDGTEGGADLKYVHAVARELADCIEDGTVIVTKSTVPVGTGEQVKKIVSKASPDLEFYIASNPEFLREGCAVEDFIKPDRVLVGVDDDRARSLMEALYRPLSDKNILVLFTDIQTAELTKYAANAFLATKIGFINEIADICEKADANIEHLARAMGVDHRIGTTYLKPGPGFGGSCFPKDTLALRKIAADLNAPTQIVDAVISSNDKRKYAMADKIVQACGGSVADKTIGVLGLAFKANTDDMRESAALYILPELIKQGAKIQAYDPEAFAQAKSMLPQAEITWCDSANDALSDVDVATIITEWDEFSNVEILDRIVDNMATPVLVDLRNLFHRDRVKARGIEYHSIGRSKV